MLKQFIPSEYCLKCDVCCRFGQKNSVYAPFFIPEGRKTLKKCGNGYCCPHFLQNSNSCNIYAKRPLDCQLYPFMVTYDKEYENIILCIDTKCPYVQKMGTVPSFRDCPHFLKNLPHDFVMPYQPDTIKIATIKNLGGFKALTLEHKNIFDKYLNVGANNYSPLQYSVRSFVNIYIWSDLFNIMWKIIDSNLCVFYEYKNEFNMLLPPIAIPTPEVELAKPDLNLGGWNGSRGLRARNDARIENIAEEEIEALKARGIKIHKNTDEYIYLTKDIAELKGNKFAKQRAAKNYFVKNNKFIYRPFVIDDIDECLKLYTGWAKQKKNKDSVYQQLIADSFSAQKKAMLNYEELCLIGRIVEIDGKIVAYTFGFKLNDVGTEQCSVPTYCIIFETADTTIKGLGQFIFNRFTQELCGLGAKYINAMDDSGLANLRRAKLSWHPFKVLTNYIGVITEPAK